MKSQPFDMENTASGHRQRLRERLLSGKLNDIADYECMELFLMLCIPRIDVKPLSKALINRFGSVGGVLYASDNDLLEIKGFGPNALCSVKILRLCIEAANKQSLTGENGQPASIDSLIKYFKSRICQYPFEVFEIVCLNSQLEMLGGGAIRISAGSASSASVDARKIVEHAIRLSASSIVLAHNHPSGNCTPSENDIYLTETLAQTCRTINVDLIEHIIVGKSDSFSFRRGGLMDKLYDSSLPEYQSSNVASKKLTLQ